MKKRGRPPLDPRTPSTPVHLKLATTDYDRADRLATQRRESIQDVIRLGLKRLLQDERGF